MMRSFRWIRNIGLVWFLCSSHVEGFQQMENPESQKSNLGIFRRIDCQFRDQHPVLGLSDSDQQCPDERGDCKGVLEKTVETHKPNGVYKLRPDSNDPLFAVCDMDQGGWTVIQQRLKGNVDFNRGWEDYKQGFGNVSEGEDYWLGNENIWRLTNAVTELESYILNIELTTESGVKRFAEYNNFRIENEANRYRLTIRYRNDTAGDAMSTYNGMEFKTDYGIDIFTYNSAISGGCSSDFYYKGGWWFNENDYDCHANLNGAPGPENYGIFWKTTMMDSKIVKVRMMIRRKNINF